MSLYELQEAPLISIVDPRTGRIKFKLEEFSLPKELIKDINKFTEFFKQLPYPGYKKSKKPAANDVIVIE